MSSNFKTSISLKLKIICSLCLPGVFCHFEEWEFDKVTRNKNSFLSLGEKCCPKIDQLSLKKVNKINKFWRSKHFFSFILRSSIVVIWKSTDFKCDFLLLRSFLQCFFFALLLHSLLPSLYFDMYVGSQTFQIQLFWNLSRNFIIKYNKFSINIKVFLIWPVLVHRLLYLYCILL